MKAIQSRFRADHRGDRARYLAFALAGCVIAAGTWISVPASAHELDVVALPSYYKPGFSNPSAARSGAGGGAGQESEQWSGTVAVPDPAGLQVAPDVHEFDVLEGYDNDRMSVAIAWDAGLALAYDLDLYVDRLDGALWVRVGSSTNGQALGDGTAVEVAQVNAPVLVPGRYRARVVNWASTQIDYTGEIAFESVRGGKGGKPSRGRATADRLDDGGLSSLHVIYMVPADGVDEELDLDGTLDAAVESMNAWFVRETPGRQMRLDTWSFGNSSSLDITFVRGEKTQAEYAAHADGVFVAITDELELRGWNDDPGLKRYVVYYGGPAESANICGTAYYNTLGTDYAQWSVVFLDAATGCGAREFGTPETGAGRSEAIAVQEMLHNEALARPQSPHHCWAFQGHLCTAAAGAVLENLDPESFDVMFPFVTYSLEEKVLDIDHDDYYEHPAPWNDLAESPFFEP
ncbi:MAG TPA: hypothetical protein VGC00_08630 [Thermoanaerobaculia bacterium]